MKRTALLLCTATAIACPCVPSGPPDDTKEDPPAQGCVGEMPTGECDVLCPPTQRTAVVGADGSCSGPDGWSGEPLATGGPLGRFCRFTWQGNDKLGEVPAGSQSECRVLSSADAPIDALRSSWRDALGIDKIRQLRTELRGPRASVRVAVIDDASPTSMRGHGVTMASIIQDIACGEDSSPDRPGCAVLTVPALTRRNASSTDPDHGEYGLQSDVALAIVQAVDTWKAEAPRDKLVVNLSLGWEPACDRGAGTVVHTAIEYATTQGALVLAASGNRLPSTCALGPVSPASWAGETSSGRHPQPLLYAVTAIDDADGFLPSFRPGSAASLVALGFMAVTASETRDPSGRLGPLSGSSVATAVAAGTAAMLWSYRPEATAHELADLMWSSGSPRMDALGQPHRAEFGPMPAKAQHTVSPCVALASLLGLSPTAANDRCRPDRPMPETWQTIWRDSDGDPATLVSTPGVASECCLGAIEPGAPLSSWVGPQPGIPPCPLCGLKGLRATVRIADEFGGVRLRATELTLWNQAGQSDQYALGDAFVTNAFRYVDNDQFRRVQGAPAVRGYITMHFVDTAGGVTTVGNVIPVSP